MLLQATTVNGRHNVGRVDHVALIYRNRDNLEKAKQEFTTLLGVTDWEDMGEVYGRVHVVVSWQSGLELIFPTRPDPALDHHLATKGEGFFSLIFGVADLDEAVARVLKAGGIAHPHPDTPAQTFQTFEVAREAVLGQVGGINLTLGEFKPKT